MIALPGWDTIESVSRWHSFFEVAGIVALALLVIFEVLAFKYGHRREELQAADDMQAAIKAGDAQKQHEKEITDLREQLNASEGLAESAKEEGAKLSSKLSRLELAQLQRHLTQAQKDIIKRFIAPHKGTTIQILCSVDDRESRIYAEDFIATFRDSGWPEIELMRVSLKGHGKFDIETQVNKDQADQGKVPPAAIAISQALLKAGLTPEHAVFRNPSVASGTVALLIHGKQ